MMNNQTSSKVLIVDDVPANLKLLRATIQSDNYNLFGAANGEDALRIAANVIPDIILLDVMMGPGIDGYEVCRRLKQSEATAHIPVILEDLKFHKFLLCFQ